MLGTGGRDYRGSGLVTCAPRGGQFQAAGLTSAGLPEDESDDRVSFSYCGIQARGPARVHRQQDRAWTIEAARCFASPVRIWGSKYEAGTLDENAQAAGLPKKYETKIATLVRLVGRQAREIEFLKRALKGPPPRSEITSLIFELLISPSRAECRLMGLPRSTFSDVPAPDSRIPKLWVACRRSATNLRLTAIGEW
jgi:hypothetical protein